MLVGPSTSPFDRLRDRSGMVGSGSTIGQAQGPLRDGSLRDRGESFKASTGDEVTGG